ncbi:MAG TPA: heparinase II/III family protein [Stellaceae bacterium]|nr:heparinase II/III family protein [Stellaceae bacterium]
MPFDNARSLDFEPDSGPDVRGLEIAVARFDRPHPYLLFHSTALPELRRRAAASPQLRAHTAKLVSAIASPIAAADLRTAIKRRARRLINTAFAALTAERSLAEPALAATRATLAELSAQPSWKERPVIRSFLDCAEIAVAVSLAYDWLFDALTASERRDIESAICRNVLEPALEAYEDRSLLWPRRRDNCTLVSNAGILVAALCVLASRLPLSARLLRYALGSNWNVFSGLAPDGAWREGLSYWSLAMRYAGLMVAALESTLGSSFGLADRPGFAQTGDFALHAVGPFGAAFNFGDSEQRYDASALVWFAHRFGRPIDGWIAGDSEGWHLPFAAIWPNCDRKAPVSLGLPTGKIFASGDIACFRSTWSSAAEAGPVFLAIKGGNVSPRIGSAAPPPEETILHAQADAGTFVVDGARHRWILDMGSDDYDLPGYFDHGADGRCGRRWQYYRSQAASHNTIVVGGRGQIPNSPAAIIGGCVDGDSKWAVIDLSTAYGHPAGTIRRGAALLGRQVVIQDEIDPSICSDITWTVHTAAEPVALTGSLARFRIGGDQFEARILEPAGGRFELSPPPAPRSFTPADADQPHGRSPDDRRPVSELPRRADVAGERATGQPIRRLQIMLPAGTPRVTVALLPDCDGSELTLPVTPLDHWLARRPVRLTGILRRGCRDRGLRAGTVGATTPLGKLKKDVPLTIPRSRT